MEIKENQDGENSCPEKMEIKPNWTVASGSLKTTVTFESSDDYVESIDCMPSSPLILTAPSDNSSPCEIKLCFKQKHEIRQVYVRSTARVYEIFYSPTWKTADEYLCTVRCSTAERDGEVLQATAFGNVEDESTTSLGESTKSNSPTETNGSSENDWVEVRNPVASYGSTDRSLSKDDFNMGSSIQDLYEATAEINDADPCTSITIRLLSLQNKSHVFIDEVYVFADPVDPSDSDNQAVQMGSSAGNGLMALLVPTLMQLSKSSSSQMHEKITSEKQTTNAEVAPESVNRSEFSDGGKEEVKLGAEQQYVMYDNTAQPNPPQLPSHYLPPVENVMPHGRIEGILEQLVSRMSRLEDYFSRLEENILKPINSMDTRLSQVEQKLDTLANNSESFGLQRGPRFYAPSFASDESISSSSFYDRSRDSPQTYELKESYTHSTDSCKHSHLSPAPESNSHVLPGFRITAPDLACSEDDEDGNVYTLEKSDVLISSGCTSLEKPKQTFGIDDALAKALSGFLETSSRSKSEEAGVQVSVTISEADVEAFPPPPFDLIATGIDTREPSEYSQVPIISIAPELTMEVQGNEEFIDSKQSRLVSTSQHITKEDVTGNTLCSGRDKLGTSGIAIDASVFTGRETIPSDISSRSSVKQLTMANSVNVDGQFHLHQEEINHLSTSNLDACSAGVARVQREVDAGQVTEKSSLVELSNDMPSEQSESTGKSNTPENASESDGCVGTVTDDINAPLNLTELPVAPVIDLEFPILEVKFHPHGSSMSGSPLEVLLYDISDIHIRTSGLGSLDEVRVAQEAEFSSEDGSNADDLPSDCNLLVDLTFDDVDELSTLDRGVDNPFTSSNQEIFESLI